MADVLILCYHALSDTWPADLAVPPDRFEAQLRDLLDRGYHGANFTDAVHEPSDSSLFAVTFDDAYRSVFDLALPILERLGLTATVFVPARWIGAEEPMSWPGIDRWLAGPHEDELRAMSRDQLTALIDAGWEVGSHTGSHPRLTQIPAEQADAELSGSRQRLEETLGRPCRSLAYPYGDVNASVAEAAEKAGYEAACTLRTWEPGRSAFMTPRVAVYRRDTQSGFRLKTSTTARKLRLQALRHPFNTLRRR